MQVLKIYLIAKQFYFTYGRSGDHRCSRHRGYSLQVDCPPHRNDSFGVQVVKEMGQKEQQIVRKTQTDKKKNENYGRRCFRGHQRHPQCCQFRGLL